MSQSKSQSSSHSLSLALRRSLDSKPYLRRALLLEKTFSQTWKAPLTSLTITLVILFIRTQISLLHLLLTVLAFCLWRDSHITSIPFMLRTTESYLQRVKATRLWVSNSSSSKTSSPSSSNNINNKFKRMSLHQFVTANPQAILSVQANTRLNWRTN